MSEEELIEAEDVEIEEQEERGDDVVFRYVGRSFVPGIPARDLTRDEADAIGWDVLRGIECAHDRQPLYEEV